jgi:collagen type I alpha
MSFQRTLLFTLAITAAAAGCRGSSNGSQKETGSSVVEGTGHTGDLSTNGSGTTVDPVPAPAGTGTTGTTTPTAIAKPNTGSTGTATGAAASGTAGATGDTGTANVGAAGTTGTGDMTATGGTGAQPSAAGSDTMAGSGSAKKPGRKTERDSTGWNRSDRNDRPNGSK